MGLRQIITLQLTPQNFKSLEYLYKIRYPKLMEKADDLAFMNYAVK